MRDPELMIGLLEEMSKNDVGRLSIPRTLIVDEQRQHRRQHVELLVDAGHAEWLGAKQQTARITNAGYDFLNATTNQSSGQKAKAKFIELFNNGVAYVRAAQAAVEVVAKTMGA